MHDELHQKDLPYPINNKIMAPETKEICSYLKDVLNFRNFIEIPDDDKNYFCISNEELKSGKITPDSRKDYLRRWMPKKTNNNSDLQNEEVEVVLIPKLVCDILPKYCSTISLNKDRAWEYRKVSLLYIKAKCNIKTMEITPVSEESLIWSDPIIKDCHPNPIIYLLSKIIEKIINKNSVGSDSVKFELKRAQCITDDGSDWQTYISKVEDNFKKRTGKDFFSSDVLADENGNIHQLYDEYLHGKTIVIKDDTVFATSHIVNLLSHIVSDVNTKLPLLESMLLDRRGKKTLVKHSLGTKIKEHAGQMKNEYPLANAQRNAVHCFHDLKDGEVLAVSGPPGTGKTTMLQSIVADMLVWSTLNARNNPKLPTSPLILTTSSNNKAITNIIDAFSSSNEDTSNVRMDSRWLCYDADGVEKFVPMAAYFPSNSVGTKRVKDYFITDTDGGGNYGALRMRYFKDSSDFYNRANTVLEGTHQNVESIMDLLSKKMDTCLYQLNKIDNLTTGNTNSAASLRKEIDQIKEDYGKNERINKFIDDYLAKDSANRPTEAKFIDRLLDLTVRYDLYWLAVHYNECLWIKRLESQRKDTNYLRKVYGKFLFEEIRYVCPCIISTFFRAPKLFEFKHKDGRRNYNYGFADLLIVDEAGQVSPEIGLPTFALAKKAIVVGDIKQIPPVYSVPEITDEDYWKKNVKRDASDSQHNLLSCCKSSIMAIAEKRCPFERTTKQGVRKDGLFLNEHRRCVDEIIDYSNQLIYGGELSPKRGSSAKNCLTMNLPPMGIYVNESPSKIKDGSRFNKGEVEVIKNWIKANESSILEAYSAPDKPKKITDLINIITPFKAQSTLIHQDDYLRKFPAGTVHTFQGAESPIVIFSMVYGKNDNPVFIKSNHELMNVAVSRAQDHFIVVGSKGCLERNKDDAACRLLDIKLKVINP